MSIPSDPTSKISRHVGEYILVRELGRGAFGTAYEARHRGTGLRWVVKEVPLASGEAEHPQLEALYTARSAETSNHVLSTNTFFFEEHAGARVLYVVSEFIEHGNLRDFLNQHQPLPVEEALELALGIGRGLVAVHSTGVVHLDLKPGNVLMDYKDSRWVPKIADFGQARPVGSPLPPPFASSGYAAPEQLTGQVSPASAADLFPFGMILAELLTGGPVAPPGDIHSYQAWLATGMRADAIATACGTRAWRPEVQDLVASLLCHEPAGRPSAASVVSRLTAVLQAIRTVGVGPTVSIPGAGDQRPGVTVAVPRIQPPPRGSSRRRLAWLLPALGAAVIAALVIVQMAGREGVVEPSAPQKELSPPPSAPPGPTPAPNPRENRPQPSSGSRPSETSKAAAPPSEPEPSAVPALPQPQKQDQIQAPPAAAEAVTPPPTVTHATVRELAPVVTPGPQTAPFTPPRDPPAAAVPVQAPALRVQFRRACGTANPVQGNLGGVGFNVERGLRGRRVTLDGPRVVLVAAGADDSATTGVELRGQFRVCRDGDAACLAFSPDCSDACRFERMGLRDQNRGEALTQLADAIAGSAAAGIEEAVSVCSKWP